MNTERRVPTSVSTAASAYITLLKRASHNNNNNTAMPLIAIDAQFRESF